MANTKKHSDNIKTIDFRGEEFRIDCAAVKSVKVQRALAGITEDANRGYWAIDKILCGNLDDALDRIPEEDGTVSDLGASDDAFAAGSSPRMRGTLSWDTESPSFLGIIPAYAGNT